MPDAFNNVAGIPAHAAAAKTRLYRGFVEDLQISGRNPLTVLDADWAFTQAWEGFRKEPVIREIRMSYRPKTRVLIGSYGSPRELFSVLGTNSGDLLLTLRQPLELGPVNGPFERITQQKFSLHRSLQSRTGARTIKRTVTYEDGRTRASAAVWQPGKAGIAAVLFTHRCAAMNTDDHLAKIRGRDRVIDLGQYDPSFSCLAYMVLAGDPGVFQHTLSPSLPFNKTTVEFDFFDIVVLHTFMNISSLPRGSIVVPATSSETWGGAAPEVQIENGVSSIELSKLDGALFLFMQDFRNLYMHQMVTWLLSDGGSLTDEECQQYEEFANTFSTRPLFEIG